MRDILKGLAALVIMLVVLVAAAVGLRYGLAWLFHGLNRTVIVAISAGVITAGGSVLGVMIGRRLEHRHQIQSDLRNRKAEVYTEFVETVLTPFLGNDEPPTRNRRGQPVDPSEHLAKAMRSATPKLVAWASGEVVTEWSRFRRAAGTRDPIEYMFMFETLLAAIRKDLGHSGQTDKGVLLGLWVNDIDDYVAGRTGEGEADPVQEDVPS